MMVLLAIGLCIRAGDISLTITIPQGVLLEKTKDAGVPGEPGSIASLFAIAATWIIYFAACTSTCATSRATRRKSRWCVKAISGACRSI
jgi:hypothetical protein